MPNIKDQQLPVESLANQGEPPWNYDGKYSPEEASKLWRFMHAEFPGVTLDGTRGGRIIVEYPPVEICSSQEWRKILDTVLVPEIGELHPLLQRRKIFVRFVKQLRDPNTPQWIGLGASTRINSKEGPMNPIRICYTNIDLRELVHTIMHELIEEDFWAKTHPDDSEAPSDETTLALIKDSDSINSYRQLLDEKIANRRALRAIRRYWPNVDWTNPEGVYEEDKEDKNDALSF